jgi:hypothetical protein
VTLLRECIRLLLEEDDDYQGQHGAPGKDSGSPLYDLTLNHTYPDDIYSSNGVRYYGDGRPRDSIVMSKILASRNKPNKRVKIYRAVPHEPSVEERINDLEKQQKYILKHGRVPPKGDHSMDKNANYNANDREIKYLKTRLGKEAPQKLTLNPGDWVSIDRSYAVAHGQGALNGKFKIVSKTVPAKQVFTAGDSFHEWGWDPS